MSSCPGLPSCSFKFCLRSDIPYNRTLDGAYYVDPVYNNWENCVSFCDQRSYAYAGVEYGRVA